MNMTEWAKREIEIACKREKEGTEEDKFNYGVACYESALKAFESLCEDGHSGMSIGFTKHILNRLIDGKPLTPIEDTEDVWNDTSRYGGNDDGCRMYQCKRMSSLFKDVYSDGSIHYHDVGRYYCMDINTGSTFTTGLVSGILNELFPITMPYMPENQRYVFITEEMKLNNDVSGDFDTFVIYSVQKPDGTIDKLNRYFTEDPESSRMLEITEDEYINLQIKSDMRKLNEIMRDEKESEE